MDNIWEIEHKLRHVLVNKQLCAKAADAICNLAKDRDYRAELLKDARTDIEIITSELNKTKEKLEKAERFIKEHF